MRMTLRDLLRNCRVALKKFLNKRDKWVKDWAGQVSWSHTNGGTVELTEQHVERQTPEALKQRLSAPPPGSGSHTPRAGTAAPDPRRMRHPSGPPRPSSARC